MRLSGEAIRHQREGEASVDPLPFCGTFSKAFLYFASVYCVVDLHDRRVGRQFNIKSQPWVFAYVHE